MFRKTYPYRACQERESFRRLLKNMHDVGEVQHDDDGFDILDVSVSPVQKIQNLIVKADVAGQSV